MDWFDALTLPFRSVYRVQQRVQHLVENTVADTATSFSQRAFEMKVREEQMHLDHLEEHGQCCVCQQQGAEVDGRRKKDGGMKLLEGHDAVVLSSALGVSVRGYLCPTCDVIRTKLQHRLQVKQQALRNVAAVTASGGNSAAAGAAASGGDATAVIEIGASGPPATVLTGGTGVAGMAAGPLAKGLFRGVTAWPTDKPLDVGVVAQSAHYSSSGAHGGMTVGPGDSVALAFRCEGVVQYAPTRTRLSRRASRHITAGDLDDSQFQDSEVASNASRSAFEQDSEPTELGNSTNNLPRASSSSNFRFEDNGEFNGYFKLLRVSRIHGVRTTEFVVKSDVVAVEVARRKSYARKSSQQHRAGGRKGGGGAKKKGSGVGSSSDSDGGVTSSDGSDDDEDRNPDLLLWNPTLPIPVPLLCGSSLTGTFALEVYWDDTDTQDDTKIGSCRFRLEDLSRAAGSEEVGPVELLGPSGELRGKVYLSRVVIHRCITSVDDADAADSAAGGGGAGGDELAVAPWALTALLARECDICKSRRVLLYHKRYRELLCAVCRAARRHAGECVPVGAQMPDRATVAALEMCVWGARPQTRDEPKYVQPLTLFPPADQPLFLQQRARFGHDAGVVASSLGASRQRATDRQGGSVGGGGSGGGGTTVGAGSGNSGGGGSAACALHYSEADGLLSEEVVDGRRRLKAATLFAGRCVRRGINIACAGGSEEQQKQQQPDLFSDFWQATPPPLPPADLLGAAAAAVAATSAAQATALATRGDILGLGVVAVDGAAVPVPLPPQVPRAEQAHVPHRDEAVIAVAVAAPRELVPLPSLFFVPSPTKDVDPPAAPAGVANDQGVAASPNEQEQRTPVASPSEALSPGGQKEPARGFGPPRSWFDPDVDGSQDSSDGGLPVPAFDQHPQGTRADGELAENRRA